MRIIADRLISDVDIVMERPQCLDDVPHYTALLGQLRYPKFGLSVRPKLLQWFVTDTPDSRRSIIGT
jgi:hypothetical protein